MFCPFSLRNKSVCRSDQALYHLGIAKKKTHFFLHSEFFCSILLLLNTSMFSSGFCSVSFPQRKMFVCCFVGWVVVVVLFFVTLLTLSEQGFDSFREGCHRLHLNVYQSCYYYYFYYYNDYYNNYYYYYHYYYSLSSLSLYVKMQCL